jgi:hypothetical protein
VLNLVFDEIFLYRADLLPVEDPVVKLKNNSEISLFLGNISLGG